MAVFPLDRLSQKIRGTPLSEQENLSLPTSLYLLSAALMDFKWRSSNIAALFNPPR